MLKFKLSQLCRSAFFLILIGMVKPILSQQIQNVDFKVVGSTIEVEYDLVDCNENQKTDVQIEFTDDKGKKYNPISLSGDVKNVTCGKGKKAVWEVLNDTDAINGSLQVMVSIIGNINIKKVQIGSQVWMTENLNVDRFRNGELIPEAKTSEEWIRAGENKQAAWCYYNNDPSNAEKYGKLYNWYAVIDPRGLAPQGWHVPSDAEWSILTDYLGYGVAAKKLKSKFGWMEEGNGSNESGFSGLPGGYRSYDGTFRSIGKYGYWWSSTENVTDNAWYRYLSYNLGNVYRLYDGRQYGFSVRCLRD